MDNQLQQIKKELLPVELIKQKIGSSESQLALALEHKKILHSSVEEVKGALKYCMIVVGLREQNWPVDEEKAVLIDFILTEYEGHTVSEIMLAFKMAVAGKLNVDANCYENFSVLYFAKIMSAYREWARKTVPLLQAPPQEPQVDLEKIEIEYASAKLRDAYRYLKSIDKLPYKIFNH
jgi:hypothetical protein